MIAAEVRIRKVNRLVKTITKLLNDGVADSYVQTLLKTWRTCWMDLAKRSSGGNDRRAGRPLADLMTRFGLIQSQAAANSHRRPVVDLKQDFPKRNRRNTTAREMSFFGFSGDA
ncbi:hypothetical protein TYRP_003707 [Tyrophagus putrescentiae]|nr:hypothetical protein TYRP_003707 [Tyrophagus putrescentiae]